MGTAHALVLLEPAISNQLPGTPGRSALVCIWSRQPVLPSGQCNVNFPESSVAERMPGVSKVRTALFVMLPLPPVTCTEYVPASSRVTGLRVIEFAACPPSTDPFLVQA